MPTVDIISTSKPVENSCLLVNTSADDYSNLIPSHAVMRFAKFLYSKMQEDSNSDIGTFEKN